MSSLLILKNIRVENANAVAGFTYGFPAITQFLGFVHALSRSTEKTHGVTLTRCSVMAHDHQIHAHQAGYWSDWAFSQTRNPLLKTGATAPIVEEGRMHMTVSLIIECENLSAGNTEKENEFCSHLFELAQQHKLAGGRITTIGRCYASAMPDEDTDIRKLLRPLLPGFLLADRTDYLQKHFQEHAHSKNMLEAWLDFVTIQRECVEHPDNEIEWNRLEKPEKGYLVPVTIGYKRLTECCEPGSVLNARNATVPFSFVEAVFSIAEWLSPSRINSMDEVLWEYKYDDPYYVCTCAPHITTEPTED
ncbi:type I-F CRISPR-associated protein Csy2 [Halodesulfovibrio sp.]|jgi:CRISPR-associated protein Csy2|uniref:type I-F CRISPR-associated protein Csy2 n=1 Tax=Halodesulfovibrio sp. TaxID=1912772 RepID=UPI002600DFFB|nr:type I-F CRISPR-associated protein Csy2 [Halodesulfovibrio sp.]MCT4627552.1 type I-F CRISPR-associated protein Csy2 [Halodesulfovibrio sp.]